MTFLQIDSVRQLKTRIGELLLGAEDLDEQLQAIVPSIPGYAAGLDEVRKLQGAVGSFRQEMNQARAVISRLEQLQDGNFEGSEADLLVAANALQDECAGIYRNCQSALLEDIRQKRHLLVERMEEL